MFAPRTTIKIDNLAAIAGASGPRWLNNGPIITGAMHRGLFKLSDLPSAGMYQSMFSSYRINAVKVEFIFTGYNLTPSPSALPNSYQLNMYTFFDPSGNYTTTFPAEADLLNMQSCKRRLGIQPKQFKAYSKVRQANVVLSGPTAGTADQYTQLKPKWISTDNLTTTHYGINTVFFTAGAQQNLHGQACQVVSTYYLEFKGAK